ncbi:non-canonical purine ntp phosphatase [Fusarium agapanthi]|uniref:inosine/xanthosine triphosphatase n=1 Tax=Fusarium agapanthi TaxID=1803897 RepID=A0A9P5B5V4_9HYPO|nr:non-canonical purine ntp phosphatase [Fusarium agapanthi]
MTTKKPMVIIGATGGQGGSVVNSFLNDPEWRVRGITRSPSSQKSRNLETRGVEVVQADLDDRVSLAKAFQDANVIFAVSDFWGIYNDPKNRNKPKPGQALNEWTKVQETQQLKKFIDEAARVSSLELFIMSSLPGNFLTHPMAQPTKKENGNIQFANNLDLDAKVPLISHDQDSGINVSLPIIFFDRQGMSTSRNNRTIVNVLAKKFALQRPRMEPPRKQKLVVVASNNIPKIKATRDGFTQMLPDCYDFQGISVDSNVSDQPFSDEETLRGATNRAQNAQAARPEADFWVGIEGGVETHNDSICSFAWIVVNGKDGKVGKARTSAYFLPDKTCQLLKEGVELGHADDMVFGQTDSKNKQGSVGLLTGGVVDRAAYYTQAVILALIPFRNASLDF